MLKDRPILGFRLIYCDYKLYSNQLNEAHGGKIITSTFVNDAAKLWNIAPDSIKQSESIHSAKKNIKIYTTSLPI